MFNENLKSIREQRGMTQKELAALLGMSMASVTAYEQAQKKPSFDVLLTIAEKLNVSLDELCGFEIKPRTWSDFARRIVALDLKEPSDGCIEFKSLSGDTYAIVFNGWVTDSGEDGWMYAATEPEPDDSLNVYGRYEENPLAKFTGEYLKMRELNNSGAVDDELFDMWLSKTYKALNSLEQPQRFCRKEGLNDGK